MSPDRQDAEFRAALSAGRARLRKLSTWSGPLSVSTIVVQDSTVRRAVLAPGIAQSAGSAREALYVGEASLEPFDAATTLTRWASIRGLASPLPIEATEALLRIDGRPFPALAWAVGGSRVVLCLCDDMRYEVWSSAGSAPDVIPLDADDVVDLAWAGAPRKERS